MRHLFRAAALVIVALVPGLASAQTTTATIRGVVHDPQGAPVPSATVAVSGRDTGISRTVQTATDGTFVIGSLLPSVVDLTVSAGGFAPVTRTGLVLEVGQTAAVDISLALAGVQERVDVAAHAAAVDTSRSVVDAVIGSAAIEAL